MNIPSNTILSIEELWQFFNLSSSLFSISDTAGNLKHINPAFTDLLGYTEEEFLAVPYLVIVHPEDVQMTIELVSEVVNSKSVSFTNRCISKTGECFWLSWSLSYSDKYQMVYATAQDITERKTAELELQKTGEELQTLFENIREVFFTVDMIDNKLIQISHSCIHIYGYSDQDFLDDADLWWQVIAEEDKKRIAESTHLLSGGGSVIHEYRIRHKDGSIRWVKSRLNPTLDSLGKPVRLDGVIANITDRKEVEQALSESEYKFRSVIQNFTEAVLIVSAEHEALYASEPFFRITGYTAEEIIGSKPFGFIHPDDFPVFLLHHEKVMKHPGKIVSDVFRCIKKDGTYAWCETKSTNFLDNPGIKGIVLNIADITERKTSLEALTKTNEDLKKTNAELDKFVYSVSHDLRAPLTSILGLVEYSELEATNADVIESLGYIKASVKKLDTFIQDILDYSRNARLGVKKEKICIHQILSGISDNLKFMTYGNDARTVQIGTDIENGVLFYTDSQRLGIVLNNLVSNAIRYANPESDNPFVHIKATLTVDEATITVHDNGIGIPARHHDSIFNMFYRVSSNSVGSGLGLYIVKETIEKLGGNIHLTSEVNKGSTFIITIPNLLN